MKTFIAATIIALFIAILMMGAIFFSPEKTSALSKFTPMSTSTQNIVISKNVKTIYTRVLWFQMKTYVGVK